MSKLDKATEINILGSKSVSNRAMILAVLSEGTTTLKNVALCDDTDYMIKGLKKLGIKIEQNGDTVKIAGVYKNGRLNFPRKKGKISIYTGNAGTTTRFLAALATLTGNEVIIDGDARMRERPIAELAKALNQLGANITTNNGCPPLHISPSKPKGLPATLLGGKVSLPGDISSQYLSAILMVTPFAEGKTIINIEQKLCSRPYVEMTLKMIESAGIKIKNKNFTQFEINSEREGEAPNPALPVWRGQREPLLIESDASSASYIGAYSALHPELKILLKNTFKNSLQGDIKFLDYLEKMGCTIIEQKNGTQIQGPKELKPLGTINMNDHPDLVMTFAVLALFTKGKTRITNIGNLRIKETDRLTALENEISRFAKFTNLPITVKTGKDWIEIERKKASSGTTSFQSSNLTISTYNDHRIAMSFGILIDIFPSLKIENPNCVSKSYTTFWQDMDLLRSWNPKKSTSEYKNSSRYSSNIILTGLRGSGKSKIGKLLAKKLNRQFIDLDKEIEFHVKMPIREIVELHGWKYFRTIEKEVTKKIAKLTSTIISTGGGTIINPENERTLKKNGKIIYLHVKPEICARRIINSKNRPSLTNKATVEAEINHLYKKRNNRYRESANLIFERSNNAEKDVARIIQKLTIHHDST